MKSLLSRGIRDINNYLNAYNFSGYSDALQKLVWNDFCSFYLETTKFYSDSETIQTLKEVFLCILILGHPIMPFITEKIHSIWMPSSGSILTRSWPIQGNINEELEENIEAIRKMITEIRGHKDFMELSFPLPKLPTELEYVAMLTETTVGNNNITCTFKPK